MHFVRFDICGVNKNAFCWLPQFRCQAVAANKAYKWKLIIFYSGQTCLLPMTMDYWSMFVSVLIFAENDFHLSDDKYSVVLMTKD